MPASHGKQKQREKQKKKREAARKKQATRPSLLGVSQASLIRQAALLPMGPCFISADWREDDQARPRLVSVIVTRKAPGYVVIPAMALVDRTCLGVKNAFVARPMPEAELADFVTTLGEAHQVGMEPCEPLLAQSLVFHGVDYARSLGFEPHRDFAEPLFGPRPATLLDTPLARPERAHYAAGPDDDMPRILDHLERRLGAGNFDFTMPSAADLDAALAELGDEEDDELDEDEPA